MCTFIPTPLFVIYQMTCTSHVTKLRTTAYGRECEVENLAELDV